MARAIGGKSVKTILDPTGLRGFRKQIETARKGWPAPQFVHSESDRMVDAIKRHTPIDEPRPSQLKHAPGELRASIKKILPRRDDIEGVYHYHSGAHTELEWASFVEDETLPHTIPQDSTSAANIAMLALRPFLQESKRQENLKSGFGDASNAPMTGERKLSNPLKPKYRLGFYWENKGRWFFGDEVNHPGVEHAAHMFLKGTEEVEAGVEARGEELFEAWKVRYWDK